MVLRLAHRALDEAQRLYLIDDPIEVRRCENVIVEQQKVGTIAEPLTLLIDLIDDRDMRFVCRLELGHHAKRTSIDATAGGVSVEGIAGGISIVDLVEDRIIERKVFDDDIVVIELAALIEQSDDRFDAGLMLQLLGHGACGDPSDENLIGLSTEPLEKVDRVDGLCPIESEERSDAYPIELRIVEVLFLTVV